MTDPIPDWKDKLRFLMDDRLPQAVADRNAAKNVERPINSMPRLAKALGLASHSSLYPISDKVSDNLRTKLGALYGFPFGSECWGEFEAGCCAEFEKEYRALHGQPGPQLRAERIALDIPADIALLAGLDLYLTQAGPGEAIPVTFDLVCQPAPVGSIEIAVKRGRLLLEADTTRFSGTKDRLAGDGPVTIERKDGSTVTISIANARAGFAAWEVKSNEGPIGVVRPGDGQDLGKLGDPAPGDEVKAVFQVYVKDLDFGDPDPDDDEEGESDPFSFLRADGKPLSPMKRAIIKALIVKEELGAPADGFVTVAGDGRVLRPEGGEE